MEEEIVKPWMMPALGFKRRYSDQLSFDRKLDEGAKIIITFWDDESVTCDLDFPKHNFFRRFNHLTNKVTIGAIQEIWKVLNGEIIEQESSSTPKF